jgi:hypothetical protein
MHLFDTPFPMNTNPMQQRRFERSAVCALALMAALSLVGQTGAVERSLAFGLDGGRMEVRVERPKAAAEAVTVEGSANGTAWTRSWALASVAAGVGGAPDAYRLRDPNAASSAAPRWARIGAREPDALDATGRIMNISTRAMVRAGSGTMTLGFVVEGGSVRVLARAAGPTLAVAPFNLPGMHPDPMLTVVQGSTTVAQNDDWGTPPANAAALEDAAKRLRAFEFASGTSLDAAALPVLSAGAFTAQIACATKAPTATGEALGEVYFDWGYASAGKIVNLSTRTLGGVTVVSGGLVTEGDRPRTLLIRAVGPKLAAFGVSPVLADPRLRVMRGSTEVASNDDWGKPVENVGAVVRAAAITGAFTLDAGSKDAAMVTTLEPGVVTIEVRGATETEGAVLIEIYDVGSPVLP